MKSVSSLCPCVSLLLLLTVLPDPARANVQEMPPDLLHAVEVRGSMPGVTADIEPVLDRFLSEVNRGDTNAAARAAEALVEAFRQAHGEESEFLAMPVFYLGLTQLENEQPVPASESFAETIELIVARHGEMSVSLVPPLQGMAVAEMEQGKYELAQEKLLRAQNLSRRHRGVDTEMQLPIIDKLIEVSRKQRTYTKTYRLHHLYLRVHEVAYGEDDPRIIPALMRVGNVETIVASTFRQRADHRKLFNRAISYYQRVIDIVETTYGDDDYRLIEPLQEIAWTGLTNFRARKESIAAMRRVVDVVKANPGSDAGDIARSVVQLADFMTLVGVSAREIYSEAWHEIPADEQYDALRDELFGEPVRLKPDSLQVGLRRKPDSVEEQEDIYSELNYVVREDGRARRIKVVGGNVPNSNNRRLRSRLFNSKFRPRVEDGEVVRTENVTLTQDYRVYN